MIHMNTGHVEQHGQGSVRSHVHHGSLVDHANQIGYMDWHLVSVHLDGNIIIIIIIIIFFHNSWIETGYIIQHEQMFFVVLEAELAHVGELTHQAYIPADIQMSRLLFELHTALQNHWTFPAPAGASHFIVFIGGSIS